MGVWSSTAEIVSPCCASAVTADSRPDPEVPAQAKRRRFSAEYKLRIVQEADACKEPGEVGALLRREGLYSSHLTAWRKQYREGALAKLRQRRGPKPEMDRRQAKRIAQLEKDNERLRKRLEQAETIIEFQKKAAALFRDPKSDEES